MSLWEVVKQFGEKATGLARPAARDLPSLLHSRKPKLYRFKDDGFTPNHPRWPLLIYRNAVIFSKGFDPAAVIEALVEHNGWGDTWRNGIYDYLHYHSRIHEALAVVRGRAKVRFGGSKGRTLEVKAGDFVILPAGTGHQCLSASKDFLVVGAYPPSGTYNECRPTRRDHDRALKTIAKAARP